MPTLKTRFKQLGKDSIVYGLGGMVARATGFILLPLYTHYFSPADYGTIETLNIVVSFLGAVLVFGMDSAQSFFFFQQRENGRESQAIVVSSILQFRLIWGALIVVISMLLSPLLNYYFFEGQLSWEYFAAAFLGAIFTQLASQSAEVYRLLYRPWPYIAITIGNALISAFAAVALISWIDWGIYGYFVGSGIGSLVAALAGWWSIRDYLDWSKLHNDWWPRLVRFGAPFIPVALGMYVLNTADRWFIIHYKDQTTLGIYAVADKFAMILVLLVTTFRQAWWPIAMDAVHSSDGPALLRMMSRLYLGIGSIGVVVLTAISPLLVRWLAAPDYYSAYTLIGVLALQPLNYGLQLIIGIGIWKAEKTIWSPVSLGMAAVINIALAFWLVPLYGGMGSAITAALSYFVWNAITLVIGEKFWYVGYSYWIFCAQIVTAILAMIGITLVSQVHNNWAVFLISIVSSLFILMITIKRSQIDWVLSEIKKRKILQTGGDND